MAEKNRHPVAQGGLWSAPKVSYSKDTQQLLNQMMKESKLNNFQQRQLNSALKDGGALPSACHPTTSAKPRVAAAPAPQSKIINPHTYQHHARTKEAIEATGAYERDQYIPKPPSFYEKDKQRLANIMAFGTDIEPKKVKLVRPPTPPSVDRFDELQNEIADRQKFLQDMEALGRGDQYRTIIATEISQLIRDMEQIDKKRTAVLERAIKEEERKRQKSNNEKIPQAEV